MGPTKSEKAVSATASLGIMVLTMAALTLSLNAGFRSSATEALTSFFVAQPAKRHHPPPPVPARGKTHAAKNPAAARAKRNDAAPIVAPPIAPLAPPSPVPVATQAGFGHAAQNGASDLPGAGQGSGGAGNGNGGGGNGEGDGEGDEGTGPVQIRGKLSGSDMPRGVVPPGSEATVEVDLTVGADGRVHDCAVSVSSRYPAIDDATCRLITQRYRYRPARDRAGRPVQSIVEESHTWVMEYERTGTR